MINLLLHTLALLFARAAMWCTDRLLKRSRVTVIQIVRDEESGTDFTVN